MLRLPHPRQSVHAARCIVGFALALCGAPACKEEAPTALASAEFGIFYGGQIQERQEIPFQLDQSKQQQGFRVVWKARLTKPAELRWELTRPPPTLPSKNALPDVGDRITQLGEALVPVGSQDYEHRFSFVAGDPLGLWNVRVTVERELAIDRSFTVFDRTARKRARQAARTPDAGK